MKAKRLSHFLRFLMLIVMGSAKPADSLGDAPRVLVEGCRLEQVAREPVIVTPVGMAFDAAGRLLVVESNTHQRPDDYNGPASDRLRMLSDSDSDGKLDRWNTIAEGFRHAMNVAVRPDGTIYLVTRSDVHLLSDKDGDGQTDLNEKIVRLETAVDYPHNALSGIALDGEKLILGTGENFGVDYKLVGSDGEFITNTGGVGMIYRANLDGSALERVAQGFWNPFSICKAEGEIFCVDNDPDASPPCRLIHVLPMGDYGFRFEYGRAGVHPLQAWNGELPGTLPMICGTGEAPTAVVFHRGYLWVTSWGDYRIERYQLLPQANGLYLADRTIVVQGEADFRPTGMAIAPDGALWFADWVDRSYPVHGKGRIWRLELPETMHTALRPLGDKAQVAGTGQLAELHQLRWNRSVSHSELIPILKSALTNPDPNVRLFAVRWLAEERLTELKTELEELLEATPQSQRYFLAVLAAVDWLSREPEQRHAGIADGLLARELRNPRRSDEVKALALSLISPDYRELTLVKLADYAHVDFEPLQAAAVQTIAACTNPERFPVLIELVRDQSLNERIRAEALAGLAANVSQYRGLFDELAGGSGLLQKEAKRTLRLSGLVQTALEEKPSAGDLEAWVRLLAEPGDAAAGRRLFFSPTGPRCGACHRHGGRGAHVGPDLTLIKHQNSRDRVITSILDPSREVAPHYESWILMIDDGKTHVGQRLPKGGDDGIEPYADTAGKIFELKSDSITHRQASRTSIMPAGLENNLSVEDLRDLMTFLMK